ncbi:hypothetical protein MLD38_003323 [Melastoma candidum]|uniref:Uncharacterized protein n=1 Tax=Melastoma candidum TaxID=119954 RepID=A0ACB9S3J6_9MYRT|nr:hypothetical protein MLD38_003323 [Melastoma candidum]
MLKESRIQGHYRILPIRGVPDDAVRVFIRFLYSSCYEEQDMEEFVLHLLVLSHVYTVPRLKRLCEDHLERGTINLENVVDIFQLALSRGTSGKSRKGGKRWRTATPFSRKCSLSTR